MRGATARTATLRQCPLHFGFVALVNLPEFDAHLKSGRKVLNQLPEVDSAVGGEIKNHLAAIKSVLGVNKLHL